jgi:hypothetical protein
MKGDFSDWNLRPLDNLTGVLRQQGRVSLDQDGNAANMIASHLRQMQGRDAIGPNVAAVPAEAKDSFKVTQAVTNGTQVDVTLHAGTTVPAGTIPQAARVWVDGWMLQAPSDLQYERENVQYFAPPIQNPQAKASEIKEGVRDAVVLEVWEEALNAFQDPQNLIEPALGGVDTTERVQLFYDIKLLRLAAPDECGNLVTKLADKFDNKGKLTVTPAPTLAITGECPVELGGGYTGLEHYLFRIEIAEPQGVNARFKWSRFNGGLVGRGTYTAPSTAGGNGTVKITANDQMINHCGLNSFYLEAMALVDKPHGRRWTVGLSADATLASDGTLTLTNVRDTWPNGTIPGEVFFRLWDGQALIADFSTGQSTPNELVSGLGIRLEFEKPDANNSYTPGDFWTFPVRTSGTEDFDPMSEWPQNAPPQGIHYHRVPLGILNWNRTQSISFAAGQIDDCRQTFPPLTNITADDVSFDNTNCQPELAPAETVQDAIELLWSRERTCTIVASPTNKWQQWLEHLKGKSINLCFQVGTYHLNKPVQFTNGHIKITGCGNSTHIISHKDEVAFHFQNMDSVLVRDISVECRSVNLKKKTDPLRGLCGALDCADCRTVTVENVTLKCAAALRRAASCITVFNGYANVESDRNFGHVRVRHCDMRIGHQQVGVLLVNVNRAQVEDNHLIVYKKPTRWTFAVMLQDKKYLGMVGKLLVANPHAIRTITASGATAPASTATSTSPSSAARAASEPIASVTYGGYAVGFTTDHTVAGNTVWQNILDKNPPPTQLDRAEDLMDHVKTLAHRAILNNGVLGNIKALEPWYRDIRQQNVAVASQGIVVGGRVAADVRITNNTIHGILQGIHVGLSHDTTKKSNPRDEPPDIAGNLLVTGNTIKILLPPMWIRQRHGIFVGSFNSLIVEDNFLSVTRMRRRRRLTLNGIYIYGRLGKRMIVRANHFEQFDIDRIPAIFIKALNKSDRSRSLWLDEHNNCQVRKNYP